MSTTWCWARAVEGAHVGLAWLDTRTRSSTSSAGTRTIRDPDSTPHAELLTKVAGRLWCRCIRNSRIGFARPAVSWCAARARCRSKPANVSASFARRTAGERPARRRDHALPHRPTGEQALRGVSRPRHLGPVSMVLRSRSFMRMMQMRRPAACRRRRTRIGNAVDVDVGGPEPRPRKLLCSPSEMPRRRHQQNRAESPVRERRHQRAEEIIEPVTVRAICWVATVQAQPCCTGNVVPNPSARAARARVEKIPQWQRRHRQHRTEIAAAEVPAIATRL